MMAGSEDHALATLERDWLARWPAALRCWSPYVQLTEPRWCRSPQEEQAEGLTGSFAMIRLVDHRVIVSLRQVRDQKLQDLATEILAHEIGHHVYCPADLTDHARLLVRLRAGLPTKEHLAPFVGNLYTDLLINDRLQRSAGLAMAQVYQRLAGGPADRLWALYMRTYELLWRLDRGTLAPAGRDARIDTDAQLAQRLARSYARDWLDGAGRFAALCLPYLLEDDGKAAQGRHAPWHDTRDAGKGGVPDGLAEIEDAEAAGALHPSEDPDLSGVPGIRPNPAEGEAAAAGGTTAPPRSTGHKSLKRYRTPFEYTQVLKAAGVTLPDAQIVARYYRELALPYLIRFPVREAPQAVEPSPEGLDTWDLGTPLERIDWLSTLTTSPTVFPGLTTRERLYGTAPGAEPQTLPLDLYLGVDCSGSMGNPADHLSYPVLAGAVIALSALRAGAAVLAALSGEPGRTITTDGFVRDEAQVLAILTGYLGTGTTFGIHRLHETFAALPPTHRPVHILIVTDNDVFSLLGMTVAGRLGWDVARDAAAKARGGATYVLQLPAYLMRQAGARPTIHAGEERMIRDGWAVAHVDAMDDLLAFARQFSQAHYGAKDAPGRRHGS